MKSHPSRLERESNQEILRELGSAKHNGSSLRVEPDHGTGVWNWWEVHNATIVGRSCDRWLRARYERTKDRMLMPAEYNKAAISRDYKLNIERKRLATLAQSGPIETTNPTNSMSLNP
jgi:hypothetical protein